MLRVGISYSVKLKNHTILLYLFLVLAISTFRQIQIGTFIPREFVIFLMQVFSYTVGYSVLMRHQDQRHAEIMKFKFVLLAISLFILLTAISNMLAGAKYSHGFNLFGFEFLFSPEWPIFSMLCLGAIFILYRSKVLNFLYFVTIFLAANSRSALLMYAFLLMRSSSLISRALIIFFLTPLVYLALQYNLYLLNRFLEIGVQLQFSDAVAYVETLTKNGLVNQNLYRQEDLSPILSACSRIGDLGRIGNTIYGVSTAIPYLGLGTGFTLMNMEILCLSNGFFHPAGPAWNPIIYAFIQGGVLGGSFLFCSIYSLFKGIKKRDTLFYLIMVLFLSSMITKGLSSYFFWTVLGMLSGYKVHVR